MRKGDRPRSVLLQVGASTLMLLLAGAHLLVDVARGFEAFVNQDGHKSNPFQYFVNAGKPTFMAKMVIYVTQTLLGDLVMTYRAYIVSGYKFITIVVPVVLCIATAVSGYTACVIFPRDKSWPDVEHDAASQWLAAFLVLATISNLWTTTLIIFLVNRSNRNTLKEGGIPVAAQRGVVATIIQSAMPYTLALFFLLVTFSANVNPEMFCIDALTPIIGISFTLIIVITGLRGRGGDEQEEKGPSKTDEDDGKPRAPQLHRLLTASKKLRLATATITSVFTPDDRAAHSVSDDQIYTPNTQKMYLTAPKALPPLPLFATMGKPGSGNGRRSRKWF
ncbi:hypothetical protein GSI_06258 [Ganoderma sinense ZZ0214-1]|uniref:Uncharacterized protein n=1 Tax=Ganoderma sinense ZZ0214-1 TaxID=1077348 RepID=A0A2G8SCQ4_9APHY|nr:hypothetical protein GSI_06258 [Ganoderma sinense ZZ0214-1]